MIRALINKPPFVNAIFVLAPEANTIVHATLLDEALNHTHRDLKLRVCMLREVKSDPARAGIQTTQEICMAYQLSCKLRTNRIRFWAGYFTPNTATTAAKMREMYREQLDGYQYVEESHVAKRDVLVKTTKVTATGKVAGAKDDLVYAAELAMIGRLRFGQNWRKYSDYIR